MKRIHLFEFEDLPWFPHWLRQCMTRFIVPLHHLMRTPKSLAPLLERALAHSDTKAIFDLCSGSCGPMIPVLKQLRQRPGLSALPITFTDLFPHQAAADMVDALADPHAQYRLTPVDATNPGTDAVGVRTMICSMHHMPPTVARAILQDAFDNRRPFCLFEISDNSLPRALWWLALPTTFLLTLLLTPWIRPLTWQQLVFTYIIPVLPVLIAWDASVSNARTYGLGDLDELLAGLHAPDYVWEKGTVGGFGPAKQLYLLGLPTTERAT